MLNKIYSFIVGHPYHIFGGILISASVLIVTQKIIEKCYRFQFKTANKPDHLIIIQHGYLAPWLQSYPLANYMAKIALQKTNSDSNNAGYVIHVIRANSSDYLFGFYATSNGIEKGGIRTCDEIKNILIKYKSIRKISLIGSSLGGLYIREVAKQLYDKPNKCLYNNLIGINFITLATPHLGVVKKINQTLVKLAKIPYFCGLLPTTVAELLGFGKDPILKQMAKNQSYLKPLTLFENKIMYANTVNDNRVSLSSGLILPSFEKANEEEFMKETYLEDIEYSRSNKQCVIKPFETLLMPVEGLWYNNVMDDAMNWKRFVVSMNAHFMSRYFAHELLSHPMPSVSDSRPVAHHLMTQFSW